MGVLTVRNLEDDTVAKLRVRAAERGRSMEAEARFWLKAVAEDRARLIDDEAPADRLEDIKVRVERAQARVRAAFGGELPKGMVDELISERRAAAARGD